MNRPRLAILLSLAVTPGTAAAEKTSPAPLRPSRQVSEYRKIAMMPLSSLGSTDAAVRAIERVLLGEFERLLGDRLVKPGDLLTQGRHVKAALHTCEGRVVCLIEVIGGLGWDAFVVGNVAGLGEGRVINLKLIDVRTGAEVRHASEKASGSDKELIAHMRKAAVELLAPHLFVGTLAIEAPQPGVTILVDGEPIGTTPLPNNRVQVTVGRHAIEATGEGLVPFSDFVEVRYNEVVPVTIHLPENTLFVGGGTPYRNRWWTWTLASIGVMATGLGGYFNYLHADTVHRIERQARKGALEADDVALYEEADAHWKRALIFYGAGGALLGGVGFLLVLDFF